MSSGLSIFSDLGIVKVGFDEVIDKTGWRLLGGKKNLILICLSFLSLWLVFFVVLSLQFEDEKGG